MSTYLLLVRTVSTANHSATYLLLVRTVSAVLGDHSDIAVIARLTMHDVDTVESTVGRPPAPMADSIREVCRIGSNRIG